MTASEFSFLALGLVLGLVSGAALIELFRARPASAHEVRLTVAHDAPYGRLVGKAVAIEPSTGFAFDTPVEPRPR